MAVNPAAVAAAEAIIDTKMDMMFTQSCTDEETEQYKKECRMIAEVMALFMDESADQIAMAAMKRWRKRQATTPIEQVPAPVTGPIEVEPAEPESTPAA